MGREDKGFQMTPQNEGSGPAAGPQPQLPRAGRTPEVPACLPRALVPTAGLPAENTGRVDWTVGNFGGTGGPPT